MADSAPGFTAIKETEEHQIWSAGPDNNHRRFHAKTHVKSTVTDSGNTNFTTVLRGGFVLGLKDSDGYAYKYDSTANDGTQNLIGLLEKSLDMKDRDGTVQDKFTRMLTAGILRAEGDLINIDKRGMATLLRMGFMLGTSPPHGSAFLLAPRGRYFKTADYTLTDADHGYMFIAATNAVNFTLPTLATVGPGYSVLLYNSVDASMVITGAANTIVYGDAGGALSTTLTFSTANKKMGGTAIMYSDYLVDGATLAWYVLTGGTVPVSA